MQRPGPRMRTAAPAPEGDSVATIVARFPKWFQQLGPAEFQRELAEDFPFLQGIDLGFVERKGAA